MDIRGIASLETKLAQFPRLGLAQLPTPLEPLKRLSAFLEGPCLWVKRDDTTGLGFGGNKLRKLDYVLHEAMAARADTLVSGGVVQSNSQRQVAAAAAKLGLDCHLAVYHGRLASSPATPCSIGCLAQRCTTCPGRGIATLPSRHSASACEQRGFAPMSSPMACQA